ncbi:MAG TPA: DUF308 domain-containing protein [Allosphingosinicella sp.]
MVTDTVNQRIVGSRTSWGWVLAIGIVMLIAGIAALFLPGVATLSASLALGWILLLYGIAGIVMGVQSRRGRGHAADLLYGVLSIFAGAFLLFFPLIGTIWLTLAVAAWLAARGIVEIIAAVTTRRERGLLIVTGLLNIILAAILIAGWPFPAVQLLGIAIAISFIASGVTAIIASVGLRRLEHAV